MITSRISIRAIWISSLAYSIVSLGLGAVAQAQTVSLNFDSLPSSQGWTYSGSPLAEDAAYFADGSKLVQMTVGSGSNSSATYEISDVVNSNREMTLSFTARVLDYENLSVGGGSPGLGFYFAVTDSRVGHVVVMTDNLLEVNDQSIVLDTTVFHDYIFDMHPDRGFDLFVDGVLFASGSGTGARGPNRIVFGDSSSDENTDVEISAVSFTLDTPDIDVRKSVDNAFPMANEPVEFTIQVSNIGNRPAADVMIIDQLPAEMIIPAGTAAFTSVGSYDPVTGEWSVGDLDAGGSAVLSIPAVVTELQPPACIVNTARSEFPDPLDDNNDEARAAIYQVGVERCVDLSAIVDISVGFFVFPSCNSERRYEGAIDIRNAGPDVARNVTISLSQTPMVGANIRFDDAACQQSGTSVCAVASIASGETLSLNVTSELFQNHSAVTQSIDISVATTDIDYDPTNDLTTVTRTVRDFSNCDGLDIDVSGCFLICPEGSSGCFIATAAYGSPLDPHLDSLRDFRDRFMMTNRPGRALVRFYYRRSPPLADFIADRDWLRAIVRGLLTPIVYTIKYPGQAALLLIGLVSFVLVRRRRHGETTQNSG